MLISGFGLDLYTVEVETVQTVVGLGKGTTCAKSINHTMMISSARIHRVPSKTKNIEDP